jgi:hypothetical protein
VTTEKNSTSPVETLQPILAQPGVEIQQRPGGRRLLHINALGRFPMAWQRITPWPLAALRLSP